MGYNSRLKKLTQEERSVIRNNKKLKREFRYGKKEVGGLDTSTTLPKKHKNESYADFKERRKITNKRKNKVNLKEINNARI